VITAKEVVAEIELLGKQLSLLDISQTSNLNLNLGLSNLGILHQDQKFQNSFSNLVNELQAVYEEYRDRPAATHWDLSAVFKAVKSSTSLITEILEEIANDEYSVLDASKYQSRFSEVIEAFNHLLGTNWRDPIYISTCYVKNFGEETAIDISESSTRSGNGLVRINQYFALINEILANYRFIRNRMDGDAAEILNNLEIANELPIIGKRNSFGNIEYPKENSSLWSEEMLPVDYLIDQVDTELFFIERLYLNVTAGDVLWSDMLWHLEALFQSELSSTLVQYFNEDDGYLYTNESGEKCLNYDGISAGLEKVRELESAYEDWYQMFQKKKTGRIF